MVQPLHIRGATIWDWDKRNTAKRDLYMTNHIVEKPASGAMTVELEGYTIFPALVNAHDHLELNHYPRSKFREVYGNAHQWGEDMNARLDTEPYKSLRAYPLWDKLFIGGLKNLLCGATTVAHHNPPHKELWHRNFPVRVLRKYGWAHSLHFSTDEEIVTSYRSAPPDVPWFIHLAEGTDDVAAGEYQRLKALGCIGKNTIIVHGVGMSREDAQEAKNAGVHLVLCPSTNLYLLNKTIYDTSTYMYSKLIIGSDSRLTAEGDLLDELRIFHQLFPDFGGKENVTAPFAHASYFSLKALRLRLWGDSLWDTGSYADFIVMMVDYETRLPAPLLHSRRTDLAMVVRDGVPRIGDPDIMAKLRHIQTVPATLDGVEKAIHIDLAQQIHACQLQEPGLEVAPLPTGRRWWF